MVDEACYVQTQACAWTRRCFLWDDSCGNKCMVSDHHIAKNSIAKAVTDKTYYHVFACPKLALLVKQLSSELAEAPAAVPASDVSSNSPNMSSIPALMGNSDEVGVLTSVACPNRHPHGALYVSYHDADGVPMVL